MLLNNLFFIEKIQISENKITADIRIEPKHPIFAGHFPKQSVLPGVCMFEILKEILQLQFQRKIQLQKSSVMKFLTMFLPNEINHATFEIEAISINDTSLQVNALMQNLTITYFKFKGNFIIK